MINITNEEKENKWTVSIYMSSYARNEYTKLERTDIVREEE